MNTYIKKYQIFATITVLIIAFWAPLVFAGQVQIKYKQGQKPDEIGLRVANNLLSRKDYMLYGKHGLHYAEACTSYSAFRLAGLTGNKELMEKLKKRYGGMIDTDKEKLVSKVQHVDHNVEGILPLEIYMQTGNERFLELGLYLADKQWENPQPDGLTNQTRWWIDDMYMVGMLQIQAYRATGDIKYADRAANQITAYIEKLQQPTGLFYHGPEYHFYWGRGNGWVASSLTEILKSLPNEHPKRPEIMNSYLKMMSTLLKYQTENGMWRQLIDYEYSWAESSCTAMFTYAMITGVKFGWLENEKYQPSVEKAWKALCAHLDREGNLREICVGTGQKDDIEFYLKRPRVVGDLHGQAPMLWCCCELLDTTTVLIPGKNLPAYKGEKVMDIKLTSTAFENDGMIPSKYTCDGDDISPPLKWDSVPDGTVSIALISDDPDAPRGTWVHWVLYNLPPDKKELPEAFPDDETLGNGTQQGVTDFGKTGYGGPCPPSGTHRYYFKIYALDTTIDTATALDKKVLLEKMDGHILAQGELMGKYKRY
ncbi:MAG: YbhB/YbcL family Raf kinase inhibitor-like protein [Sedimentisphaerales bacterium]|nr:YbhB/YbcL family Raf kinase inhibitor-like protein [Sedimentisphaerales bacterium]